MNKKKELRNTVVRDISEILGVRVGGKQSQLVTLTPVQDLVFCQGKRTVIHWVLYTTRKKRGPWVIIFY